MYIDEKNVKEQTNTYEMKMSLSIYYNRKFWKISSPYFITKSYRIEVAKLHKSYYKARVPNEKRNKI